MIDDATTDGDDSTYNCPHGSATCAGPDSAAWDWSSTAPCFDCYQDAVCASGHSWCAGRRGADGGRYCRRCALKHRRAGQTA
jgi:hypothetical protein